MLQYPEASSVDSDSCAFDAADVGAAVVGTNVAPVTEVGNGADVDAATDVANVDSGTHIIPGNPFLYSLNMSPGGSLVSV